MWQAKPNQTKQSEILPFLAALFNSLWLLVLFICMLVSRFDLLLDVVAALDVMHIKRQGAFFAYLKALSKIAPYLGFRSF